MRPATVRALYLAEAVRTQEIISKLGLNQDSAVLCFQTPAELAQHLREVTESRGIPLDALLSPLLTEVLGDILSDPGELEKRLDALAGAEQASPPDLIAQRARVVASFALASASSRAV